MRRSHNSLKGSRSTRLLLCATLVVQTAALAQEDISEQAYLEDLPVVLSASRLLQPLSEAPNAMTVIDRRMIRDSGFRNIADLFRLVPGMYVGYLGANTPIVSLNGVSDQYSRRMQVLVDGRSVYLPPFGGVDWLDLPLLIDDIERIEVVRGPAAASHGTNSFYGVINIITRDAASAEGQAVKLNHGERGISDLSAQIGKTGERFDYRLSAGYRSDDGDNQPVMNDGSISRIFNLRSAFRIDDDDSLELQLGLNHGSIGMGTTGRFQEPFRALDTQNDFQQFTWQHTWGANDETRITWYRINRDQLDPYVCTDYIQCEIAPPAGFAEVREKRQRQDLELQNTMQLGDDNRVVWGAGVRRDFADQPETLAVARSLNQARFFAHDEWRITESTLLNAGAMIEDDGAGHRDTSPRLSLNHHLVPGHTLRASLSSATRNPVMVEMYMTTQRWGYWRDPYLPPVEPLRPERIQSREIGYIGEFGALDVDVRVYHERVSDVIVLDYYADVSDLSNPKNSFKNMIEATFSGLDLSAGYRWEGGRIVLNYAHQRTDCSFSAYPTQYFNPMLISATSTLGQFVANAYQTDYIDLCAQSVPSDSGSLLLSQDLTETLRFSAGYYLRGKVRIIDASSSFPPESPMHRVDLRLAAGFGPQDQAGGGEIAVVVQNAFQDNYTSYGNVPQRVGMTYKRRAYLTATLNF